MKFKNWRKFKEENIIWDTTQPTFSYLEKPVLTFTGYLVYCGGLVGLWFGTSAQDVLVYFKGLEIWKVIRYKFIKTTVRPFHDLKKPNNQK